MGREQAFFASLDLWEAEVFLNFHRYFDVIFSLSPTRFIRLYFSLHLYRHQPFMFFSPFLQKGKNAIFSLCHNSVFLNVFYFLIASLRWEYNGLVSNHFKNGGTFKCSSIISRLNF